MLLDFNINCYSETYYNLSSELSDILLLRLQTDGHIQLQQQAITLWLYSSEVRCWLPLTWWEVDERHTLMAEPLDLFELLPAPQGDASLMESSQVGAFRRPANVRLCPALHRNTKTSSLLPAVSTFPHFLLVWPVTYRSLFYQDRLFGIIWENGRPLSSFVDHTVLVTAVWVLNPMTHITLNGEPRATEVLTSGHDGVHNDKEVIQVNTKKLMTD